MGETDETAVANLKTAATPHLFEAHTDPDRPCTSTESLPEKVRTAPVANKSPAQWAYERTVVYLQKFEEQLDSDHEAAMGFVGADAGVLRIEGMGYFDPDIVTFYGADPSGSRMQLIQHVSQLNVILRAVPKAVQDAAPQRIGFRLVQDLEQDPPASS